MLCSLNAQYRVLFVSETFKKKAMSDITKIRMKKIHQFIISVLMSALVWSIINIFIFKISFIQYIIIEISAGIGELVIDFVKKKYKMESLEKKN